MDKTAVSHVGVLDFSTTVTGEEDKICSVGTDGRAEAVESVVLVIVSKRAK